MPGKDSNKTPKSFRRKKGRKKTLPDFGIFEFYYYHLLLRMEEFDEIASEHEFEIKDFNYRNIVSILFTIIPEKDLNVENAHNYRFYEDEPTALEIFIETRNRFPEITWKLIQVLLNVTYENDQLTYHFLESDLSRKENIDKRIADDVRPIYELFGKELPIDDSVFKIRSKLDKKRKDWLRLKEKYYGKFYPLHLSG
ncbi:hypothetical protein N8920_02150 [Opitutales bacterium]|nr:hypothetical protein [Opitutales bacterium]